jgi:hypothetical protein
MHFIHGYIDNKREYMTKNAVYSRFWINFWDFPHQSTDLLLGEIIGYKLVLVE